MGKICFLFTATLFLKSNTVSKVRSIYKSIHSIVITYDLCRFFWVYENNKILNISIQVENKLDIFTE